MAQVTERPYRKRFECSDMMPRTGERPDPDNYWKIVRPYIGTAREAQRYLESHGFHFPKDASYNRLLELYSRCQRHLLPYDGCSQKELMRFVTQRGLPSLSYRFHNTSDRTFLIHQLEVADDIFVFDRFFLLPNELRKLVFEFSFSGMEPGKKFKQPPVTRASRQLREEALPLFYQTCTFPLYADCTIYKESSHFFFLGSQPRTSVPPRYLVNIKNLHINVTAGSFDHMAWLLRIRGCEVQIEDVSPNWTLSLGLRRCAHNAVSNLLKRLVEDINASRQPPRLQPQLLIDIVALVNAGFDAVVENLGYSRKIESPTGRLA